MEAAPFRNRPLDGSTARAESRVELGASSDRIGWRRDDQPARSDLILVDDWAV